MHVHSHAIIINNLCNLDLRFNKRGEMFGMQSNSSHIDQLVIFSLFFSLSQLRSGDRLLSFPNGSFSSSAQRV